MHHIQWQRRVCWDGRGGLSKWFVDAEHFSNGNMFCFSRVRKFHRRMKTASWKSSIAISVRHRFHGVNNCLDMHQSTRRRRAAWNVRIVRSGSPATARWSGIFAFIQVRNGFGLVGHIYSDQTLDKNRLWTERIIIYQGQEPTRFPCGSHNWSYSHFYSKLTAARLCSCAFRPTCHRKYPLSIHLKS